jgi:hypothetical protein
MTYEAWNAGKLPDGARIVATADGQSWDASQIKQPGWNHVEAAFIEGAREARANPDADDAMVRRAADGYTKRVFEEVDPVSETALRTASWKAPDEADVQACPNAAHMGEHACANKAQCWEPCGLLGNDEKHVRVGILCEVGFNGVKLWAYPGTDPAQLAKAWAIQMERPEHVYKIASARPCGMEGTSK